MRSLTRSRYYVQCPVDDRIEDWSDERFWDELRRRLDPALAQAIVTGPSIEKSIAPLRSFVAEPMRFGRLFLAGDAAHIVPPTGAKGLNLAAADVIVLARAFAHLKDTGSAELLDAYSDTCLKRVWRAEHFSYFMTTTLHTDPDQSPFDTQLQISQLDRIANSPHAAAELAENYAGLHIG
jgi:p-hydroxybenzoate 3-monooxygenase